MPVIKPIQTARMKSVYTVTFSPKRKMLHTARPAPNGETRNKRGDPNIYIA